MKLLQMTNTTLDQSLTEPTLPLSIAGYLAHAQVQPLTDLMVDIIIFQWRERALFTEVELPASCLNWFFFLIILPPDYSILFNEPISYQ